jgi:hypothetical protein
LRRLVLLALVLCAAAAPVAHADGDPASDWLLQKFAFVPPDTGIAQSDSNAISELLRAAHAKGYTLHVAVVPSRYDMGAVTVLYKRPHQYAPFLSQELRFFYRGRVLVVMPNGYAIARDGKTDTAEQKVLNRLPLPHPFKGAPLAAATESAIRALAANAGVHVVPVKPPSGESSSATRDRIVIAAIAAAIVLLGALAFKLRRRGGSARRPSP